MHIIFLLVYRSYFSIEFIIAYVIDINEIIATLKRYFF